MSKKNIPNLIIDILRVVTFLLKLSAFIAALSSIRHEAA